MSRIHKLAIGILTINVLYSCSLIMPTTTTKPSVNQSSNSATLTMPKLNFKIRPANEPFDPVDHLPEGYSKLTAPKIIANSVATLNTDAHNISKKEYNTAPHYIKKFKKEISIRLSYPTDWKGNYYKFRKSLPLTKIEMINYKDT